MDVDTAHMDDRSSLAGHLLIAMPAMRDPNFFRTVTYICEHSDQGALGIVINRPMDLTLRLVFQQLSLPLADDELTSQPVMHGGPVHEERGFVLHESGMPFDSTLRVAGNIHVTTSQDILAAIAGGHGPQRVLVALGYAGWGAGQLDEEMIQNAWLSVPATPQIIFETPFDRRWQEAARLLGIDLANMSPEAGHA